ncbi:hypothetical protein IE53DRAFT_86224 [Violaceomyces palustris]|uniref:Uncharacterized protein n=1 Tax=Violaceomyces palustris TaxID=1673888 RepID=A0ACD0NXR6_9BASI|nr:hypothetical protein IE53DRAFT_86224 [Violaceomyces palustris]
MSYNPLAILQERQCAQLYNSIDTGNNRLAIQQADRLLRSNPDFPLASALKSIALIRSGQSAKASEICDALLKRGLNKGEESTLHPLRFTLLRLGRSKEEVQLLEGLSKASPANLELATDCFLSMIRNRMYQKAQPACLRLLKTFKATPEDDRFFWWSIQSYLLVSKYEQGSPGAALALPLAERMILKHLEEVRALNEKDDERLYLYFKVLQGLGKDQEAFDLVTRGAGRVICGRNLGFELERRDLAFKLAKWDFIRDECKEKIEAGGKDWAHIQSFIRASVKMGREEVASAKELLLKISSSGNSADRGARMSLLELYRETYNSSTTQGTAAEAQVKEQEELLKLCSAYFETFSTKACCFEDLLPYVVILSTDTKEALRRTLQTKLESDPKPSNENELFTRINIWKILRSTQTSCSVTGELSFSKAVLKAYVEGLPIGRKLPDTEMQPADDLALLSAQALVSAFRLDSGQGWNHLLAAAGVLEFALKKSKKGYALRLLLVKIYLLLGCYDLASKHYSQVGVKGIQNDTISHFITDRASLFALGPDATKEIENNFKASTAIYRENAKETPEMVTKAFQFDTYSRIEEFIEFGEAVERSTQRQVSRVESLRIKLIKGEGIEPGELDVLKHVIASKLPDQRDYEVLRNFEPLGRPSIEDLVAFSPRIQDGFVKAMFCILSTFSSKSPEAVDGPDFEVLVQDDDLNQLTPMERALYRVCKLLQSCSNPEEDGDEKALEEEVETFSKTCREGIFQLCSEGSLSNYKIFEVLSSATLLYRILSSRSPQDSTNAATSKGERAAEKGRSSMKSTIEVLGKEINQLSRTITSNLESRLRGDDFWKGLGGSGIEGLKIVEREIGSSMRRNLDGCRLFFDSLW